MRDDSTALLLRAPAETVESLSEAIEIASSFKPPRYVARTPWGPFAIFQVGERPCGHDRAWPRRPWLLSQITVFLPRDYTEQPGSAVASFTREAELYPRISKERENVAISEGELEAFVAGLEEAVADSRLSRTRL